MSNVDKKAEIPEQQPGVNVSIDIGDLQNALNVIDFACEQGAFKGWGVIREVMVIREKLATFLAATAPARAASAEPTQQGNQEKVKTKSPAKRNK